MMTCRFQVGISDLARHFIHPSPTLTPLHLHHTFYLFSLLTYSGFSTSLRKIPNINIKYEFVSESPHFFLFFHPNTDTQKLNLRFGLAALFWLGSLEIIIIINLHSTFIMCLFDCFDVIYREFISVNFHFSSSPFILVCEFCLRTHIKYRITIQTKLFYHVYFLLLHPPCSSHVSADASIVI